MDHRTLISDIFSTYREIDHKIVRLQHAASLTCPDGCGSCCDTQHIEATLLEALPLAEAIFNSGEEESMLLAIEEKLSGNDFSCALYRPDTEVAGNGLCAYYRVRPLLCRLFGFAARRNRLGEIEFSTCKRIRALSSEGVQRAEIGISAGLEIPIFHESFMRIASQNPSIGFQRLPINIAIKEALEYLYWRNFSTEKLAKAC